MRKKSSINVFNQTPASINKWAAAGEARGEQAVAFSSPQQDAGGCIFVLPLRREGGNNFCDPGSLVPWHTASKQAQHFRKPSDNTVYILIRKINGTEL